MNEGELQSWSLNYCKISSAVTSGQNISVLLKQLPVVCEHYLLVFSCKYLFEIIFKIAFLPKE